MATLWLAGWVETDSALPYSDLTLYRSIDAAVDSLRDEVYDHLSLGPSDDKDHRRADVWFDDLAGRLNLLTEADFQLKGYRYILRPLELEEGIRSRWQT